MYTASQFLQSIGLWAKAGRDDNGVLHILLAARREDIEVGGHGHDHYFKKNGEWYVSVNLSSNLDYVNPHTLRRQEHMIYKEPHETHEQYEARHRFTICPDYILDDLYGFLVEQ